jgi:hypothetical protein
MTGVIVEFTSGRLHTHMHAMRLWLDEAHIEPSRFTCTATSGSVRAELGFRTPKEAARFLAEFGGRLISVAR